jgi:hypothetical protein
MISFILPTLGRPGLLRALDSIELWPGDEVLVIGEMHALDPYIRQSDISRGVRFLHCPRGHDWGHSERNFAQPYAKGRYIANLDDDDIFVPGHRLIMDTAMVAADGRPIIFKMSYPNGFTLWHRSHFLGDPVEGGNVGTPMMFFPNDPAKLGRWGQGEYCGDFTFLRSCQWELDDYVWRTEIIALIGRNQHEEVAS